MPVSRRSVRLLIHCASVVVATHVAPTFAQTFIGQNFTASTRPTDSTFNPPDTMGAVGVNHFVELINGRYSVYRKSDGVRVQTSTLDAFWAAAGAPHSGSFSFDPRVQYDPYVKRWYACSTDAPRAANSFMFAVSNSSDPTSGWTGFKIDSDADDVQWADFPTMGHNADAVVLSANMFPIAAGSTNVALVVIPKSGLLAPTPTVSGATSFLDFNGGLTGFSIQPAVDQDNGSLPLPLLSSIGSPTIKRSSVTGTALSPTIATAGGSITVPAYSAAPNADQPGPKANINVGDNRFSGTVVLNNGELWGIHNTSVAGRAALRWYRINGTTNALIESGTITDPSLAYFYPSIAVNDFGDVVIGMSGTDPATFVSTYAVVGKTVAGTTTFGAPFQTKAGVSDFERFDTSGRNRWGDYSATTVDPADPSIFWTIQEYVSSTDEWSTQATEIILPQPGEVRWKNPATGGYTNGNSWFGGSAPSAASHVIFSRATDPIGGTYTVNVSVGASATVDRLSARQGNFTLDLQLNTLNATNTSINEASFMVGEYGGTPRITIANGTLNTRNTIVARQSYSEASIVLSNATWINQANVWLGGDATSNGGIATIEVGPGSSLSIAGTTKVRPGGLLLSHADAISVGSLDMSGGQVTLAPGGGRLLLANQIFMTAGAGMVDLNDNTMVIDYSSSSPLITVRDRIRDAHNNGAWDGSGITTSLGDATNFALGFTDDGDKITIDFTRYGDANLDNFVNVSDFTVLAGNFGSSGKFWFQGDFNYDGLVNVNDFTLLAGNFNLAATGPNNTVSPQDWANLAAAVPEPVTGVQVLVMAACLCPHRRFRRAEAS